MELGYKKCMPNINLKVRGKKERERNNMENNGGKEWEAGSRLTNSMT